MKSWQNSSSEEIGMRRPRVGIDFNESRRAAQDAMDEMRKNRIKHGRIKVYRGAPPRFNERKA